MDDYDVIVAAEAAAFELLLKFHRETECGEGGSHWAECERLVCAFGYSSWDVWVELVRQLS